MRLASAFIIDDQQRIAGWQELAAVPVLVQCDIAAAAAGVRILLGSLAIPGAARAARSEPGSENLWDAHLRAQTLLVLFAEEAGGGFVQKLVDRLQGSGRIATMKF